MAFADSSFIQNITQYLVIGRAAPTQRCPAPKVYRMRIFARNEVAAVSKFWYFMAKLTKAKASGGQILHFGVITPTSTTCVKNYGIHLRYDSRTDTINMYKEYRAISANHAVSQMYSEMAGRHRARSADLQIISVEQVANYKDGGDPKTMATRPHITQITEPGSSIRFPVARRLPFYSKDKKKLFVARRPTTATFF